LIVVLKPALRLATGELAARLLKNGHNGRRIALQVNWEASIDPGMTCVLLGAGGVDPGGI